MLAHHYTHLHLPPTSSSGPHSLSFGNPSSSSPSPLRNSWSIDAARMSHTPDYGGQNPRSSPSQEAGPSRSPAPSGDQHAYLPFESLSSPSAPRMLPSTAAVLQARRQAFFKSPSSSRAAAAASIAASASRQASRNDTGMQLQAGPAPPRLRRTGWRSPQSGSAGAGPDADSPQQHVWRARFRERCQQHMRRDRARAVAKSRAQVGRPELMGSDELESSSDVEGDEEMAEWEEEDEEVCFALRSSQEVTSDAKAVLFAS